MNHLSAEMLEAFVTGALPNADEIQSHVAVCPACAQALAREARIELAMREVAAQIPSLAGRERSRFRPLWTAVAATAAAAAFLLWANREAPVRRASHAFARPDAAVAVGPAARLPMCEGARPGHCVRAAQQLGLAVVSESHGFVVPIYERATALSVGTP